MLCSARFQQRLSLTMLGLSGEKVKKKFNFQSKN